MSMNSNLSYQSLAQVFELRPHNKAFENVTVLNRNEIEYFVYLHIPENLAIHSELFGVGDLDHVDVPIDYEDLIQRNCKRPWLRVESRLLDLTAGQHTYRFSFVNQETDDVYSLYISYIIQDDNPDKPYIYMDGKEEDDGICNICQQIVPGQ